MKRPSSWSDTPLWPISLGANQHKGCQKDKKSNFTKSTFQTPGWFGIIKEVFLSCFGMKTGPAWGVVACYVETQCQNLNWISVQTTGVVLLSPNFMSHLVKSFKHDLYQKSHISGHLLCCPPLQNYCPLGHRGMKIWHFLKQDCDIVMCHFRVYVTQKYLIL